MKHARKLLFLAAFLGIVIYSNAPAQPQEEGQGNCLSNYLEPVKGKVGYTFVTDYMFRGLNMSDILGGHIGRGNHEFTYGISVDLSDVGIEEVGEFGITAKNAYLIAYQNTTANRALTDITLSLTRPCELLEMVDGMLTIEWRNYRWDNQNTYTGGTERTKEVTVGLSFSDGTIIEALTGEDMGANVLNPTIKWICDYELADGGQLWILGLSHPVDMAQCMPELAGITLKPSWSLVVENRYYGSYVSKLTNNAVNPEETTRFAYMEWGLGASADLTDTVGLNCGKLGIQGGLGYVQALEKLQNKVLHDNLYSYVSLVYEF